MTPYDALRHAEVLRAVALSMPTASPAVESEHGRVVELWFAGRARRRIARGLK